MGKDNGEKGRTDVKEPKGREAAEAQDGGCGGTESTGEGKRGRRFSDSLVSLSLCRRFFSHYSDSQALGLGSEISTRGVWAGAAELGLGLPLLGCRLDWTGLGWLAG